MDRGVISRQEALSEDFLREVYLVLSRNPTRRAPTGSTNSPSTIIYKTPKVGSKQKTPTHEWINKPVHPYDKILSGHEKGMEY